MILIRDSPCWVRGGRFWVRGGPGPSISHPGWSGVIRVDTMLGPGRSVTALPWLSGVIRVGSVFIHSAAVLSPGWSGVMMFFNRRSSVEGPSKHFQSRDRQSIFTLAHPGSRHLLVWSTCSGVIRDGLFWVWLWCDLISLMKISWTYYIIRYTNTKTLLIVIYQA